MARCQFGNIIKIKMRKTYILFNYLAQKIKIFLFISCFSVSLLGLSSLIIPRSAQATDVLDLNLSLLGDGGINIDIIPATGLNSQLLVSIKLISNSSDCNLDYMSLNYDHFTQLAPGNKGIAYYPGPLERENYLCALVRQNYEFQNKSRYQEVVKSIRLSGGGGSSSDINSETVEETPSITAVQLSALALNFKQNNDLLTIHANRDLDQPIWHTKMIDDQTNCTDEFLDGDNIETHTGHSLTVALKKEDIGRFYCVRLSDQDQQIIQAIAIQTFKEAVSEEIDEQSSGENEQTSIALTDQSVSTTEAETEVETETETETETEVETETVIEVDVQPELIDETEDQEVQVSTPTHPTEDVQPKTSDDNNQRLFAWILLVVITAGATVGYWLYLRNNKDKK